MSDYYVYPMLFCGNFLLFFNNSDNFELKSTVILFVEYVVLRDERDDYLNGLSLRVLQNGILNKNYLHSNKITLLKN